LWKSSEWTPADLAGLSGGRRKIVEWALGDVLKEQDKGKDVKDIPVAPGPAEVPLTATPANPSVVTATINPVGTTTPAPAVTPIPTPVVTSARTPADTTLRQPQLPPIPAEENLIPWLKEINTFMEINLSQEKNLKMTFPDITARIRSIVNSLRSLVAENPEDATLVEGTTEMIKFWESFLVNV
jgi:hypothetical protein